MSLLLRKLSCTLKLLQVTAETLEVGASVLLPPFKDRVEFLLNLIPDDSVQFNSLSCGQVSVAVSLNCDYLYMCTRSINKFVSCCKDLNSKTNVYPS